MAVSPPVDLPVRWELSRRSDGTGTLAFTGELDTESTPLAWRSLEGELAGSRLVRLEVDVRRLGCDSAGLALLYYLWTGAIHLGLHEIEKRHGELPHDRHIIVYCSCPSEVTSARVALSLQRSGFTHLRPLPGGIDAWRESHYPTQIWSAAVTTAVGDLVVDRGRSSPNTVASKALIGNAAPTGARRKESEHGAREQQA